MNITCVRYISSRALEVSLQFAERTNLWPESWAAVWGSVCTLCGVMPPLHDIPALTTDPAMHVASSVEQDSNLFYARYILPRQDLPRMASIFDALGVESIIVSLYCESRAPIEVKQGSL